MKTIKLTVGQSVALRHNRFSSVRIKRNNIVMYISDAGLAGLVATDWLGNELDVLVLDCWS
jgi:hypothetical protein